MNQPDGNSLDERSRAISAALNIQRRTLFARVVHKADEPRSFPRSVTMRVLIRKPALLTRLLPVLMSTRRLGVVASRDDTCRSLPEESF